MKKSMVFVNSDLGSSISVSVEFENGGKSANGIHIRKSDVILVYIEGANLDSSSGPCFRHIIVRMTNDITIYFRHTENYESASISDGVGKDYIITVPTAHLSELFDLLKNIGL